MQKESRHLVAVMWPASFFLCHASACQTSTPNIGNVAPCIAKHDIEKKKPATSLQRCAGFLFSYSFLSAFFIVLQASATYPAIQRMCAATERRFAVSAPSGSHRDR